VVNGGVFTAKVSGLLMFRHSDIPFVRKGELHRVIISWDVHGSDDRESGEARRLCE
jgi:hypothetical protein